MSDENHRVYYNRWAEFMAARDWDELTHPAVR